MENTYIKDLVAGRPPVGSMSGQRRVGSDMVRGSRQGVPRGSYCVDAEALRRARQGTPTGEYHVDAEALRRARQGTPTGEYHWLESQSDDGFHSGPFGGPYPPERCWNCGGFHPPEHCRVELSVH